MGDSLRAGSDYNTRLYEGKGWWVGNSILFFFRDEKCKTKKEPIFSTGKCESVLSTFSIPLYQNDKKGRRACFLFSCSISSISAPLVVTYVEERKDCTAFGPGSEGNELGCLSSTLLFFLRAPFACASRAIGALLSSYSSLDGSDGLRRSFPTKIEKAVSHRDVDSFSAPNEMGNF
ncbi:hypothetical protein TSUD_291690 [Trifolium subterraneum]|uniref:Uncharacterized protein n=1 Tax=Trifolium subterraneum TaxID=3900 RepID=A0A2Z6NWD9_TRISU|nr:hypothetical protein TSUD_291690 [Trifolium subterraneum]